jgi:hypothetical protein
LPTAPFPELRHFESIESALKKALKDKDSKASAKSGKTAVKVISRVVVNKDTIGQLQNQLASNYGSVTQKIKLEAPAAPDTPSFNSFVTPAKRGRPSDTPGSLPASSRPRMLPTPAGNDFMATPAETPESAKYSAREEKFKVISTMNEALAAAVPVDCKSSRCETKLLQGIQLYKGGRPVVHRYMFERVEQKCNMLRDRLRSITDGIILRNGLNQKALEEDGCELQMSPVNMPAQEKAWYCGRICCEGDNGNINASSVLLEGANGKRVRLELSHVVQFAVFPGQIVVLRGNNTSGESIIVREMWSDATLPMAKTPADKMATWNETEAFLGGMPLSIMTASGPFTSSADLTYKPLQDLLDHAAQQKPDVLILTGPFVDCKHRQLNPETAGTVGGFNDPPDSLQVVRHVMRDLIAERLSAGSPTTTCVLVPCLEDLHSRTTFPQPPFDQAEIIQAMDGEMDVAQRVDVQIVGNPCMLRINEILVSALPTPSVACPATKPRAALVTVSRASSATSCSSEVFTRSSRQLKGAKCQRPTSATLACSRRPTSCCSPACSTPLPRGSGTSCVSIPANSPGAAGLAPSPASRFIPLFATCGLGLLEALARSLLALLSRLRPWSIPPTRRRKARHLTLLLPYLLSSFRKTSNPPRPLTSSLRTETSTLSRWRPKARPRKQRVTLRSLRQKKTRLNLLARQPLMTRWMWTVLLLPKRRVREPRGSMASTLSMPAQIRKRPHTWGRPTPTTARRRLRTGFASARVSTLCASNVGAMCTQCAKYTVIFVAQCEREGCARHMSIQAHGRHALHAWKLLSTN